jgi:dTDP-4-dehydrorhamnose reductase
VIHTAAIRELDFCERYPEIARSVNIVGTKNVLQAAVACSADFCLISSDAVFSGKRMTPYGENAIARPCSVYGQTKLAAERITARWPKHYIFRVSVLFGPGKLNFFETVLRTVAAGQQYTAATDQIGSATYTPDATRVIKRVVERQTYGLFHLCNPGIYSRFEFACLAASIAGLDPSKITGKRRDEFCGEARRSEYSGMRMDRLLTVGIPLPRLCSRPRTAFAKQCGESMSRLGTQDVYDTRTCQWSTWQDQSLTTRAWKLSMMLVLGRQSISEGGTHAQPVDGDAIFRAFQRAGHRRRTIQSFKCLR